MTYNLIKRNLSRIFGGILALPIVLARRYEEPVNISGFVELMQWSDRVTGYMYGLGIVIMVFMISFILLKSFESKQAFTGCLFLTMVTAWGLWGLQILNVSWVIGINIICGLIVIGIMWSRD
jgi:uncharacterized membrane protein (DUF485 family)